MGARIHPRRPDAKPATRPPCLQASMKMTKILATSLRDTMSLSIRPTSRAAGKEGRLATDIPPCPPRGYAARVAGPECTDVLEDRKRRPDGHGQRPIRVGAGGLCPPEPVAGGFGNPLRVPIRIVGRSRLRGRGGASLSTILCARRSRARSGGSPVAPRRRFAASLRRPHGSWWH